MNAYDVLASDTLGFAKAPEYYRVPFGAFWVLLPFVILGLVCAWLTVEEMGATLIQTWRKRRGR
jgi:hypothetical protein